MIQKISRELSGVWATGGVIKPEDVEIYEYGLQLLISSAINILVIVAVSFALRLPFAWIPFIAAFIPLRTTAGGYHAKTHFSCIFSFGITFTLLLVLTRTVAFVNSSICFGISSLFSIAVIIAFSPVQASNKPLTIREAVRNRKRSIIIAICFLIPAILSLYLPALRCNYLATFYCGELAATISLIVVKVSDHHAK